jgi:hypothetical protein
MFVNTIILIQIILRKTTVTPPIASISTSPKTTSEATTLIMKTRGRTKTTLPSTTKTEPSSNYLTTRSIR